MNTSGRILASLVMLAIFLVFVVQALAFNAEARMMPLIVGIPGIVLCFWQFMIELRSRKRESVDGAFFAKGELPVIVWLLVFTGAIIAFGFSFGAPPMVAIYLYTIARERLHTAIISALFCFVFLYVFFERMMNAQLFEGLLTRHLF